MDMESVHDHVKKCASTTIVPSGDRIKVNERFCTEETTAMGVSAFPSYVLRISRIFRDTGEFYLRQT
jgi:hypothetical protein